MSSLYERRMVAAPPHDDGTTDDSNPINSRKVFAFASVVSAQWLAARQTASSLC